MDGIPVAGRHHTYNKNMLIQTVADVERAEVRMAKLEHNDRSPSLLRPK
jgi:hypothetical protein